VSTFGAAQWAADGQAHREQAAKGAGQGGTSEENGDGEAEGGSGQPHGQDEVETAIEDARRLYERELRQNDRTHGKSGDSKRPSRKRTAVNWPGV
jgi:hypothetical protein